MTKKLLVLLMSVLLVAALLTGCGGSRPTNVREYMEANPSELAEFEAEMELEVQQMATMFGIDMSIRLDIIGDHELRLSYTLYDNDFLVGTELGDFLGEFLAEGLEEDSAFYTEMATEMRNEINISTLYLTMRYLDANGGVLAERTFAGH
ncbi:MAG: DUF4854 domain-containing protein [Oscillospiraceae bacterium]|nr:DUF4854 domain-containing protein [Oscillospiraceae bacterium]